MMKPVLDFKWLSHQFEEYTGDPTRLGFAATSSTLSIL